MCMSFNIIGHMYVMHHFTTYMWSLCNIFLPLLQLSRLSWRSQFNGHANLLFPQNIWIVLDSVLPARWYFLPPVYTCLKGVAVAQHSEATLTTRVIRMFECVCVRGGWDHYSLSREKIALRTPSTRVSLIRVEFESTHTEAGLVGVGGLVAWLEACVRIAGGFPQ